MFDGNGFLAWLSANYHWQASLLTVVGLVALVVIGERLVLLIPAFREADQMNRDMFEKKRQRQSYRDNLKISGRWSLFVYAIIFAGIMPFFTSPTLNVWWRLPVDVFALLMLEDFFYYLMHRYLFHNHGFLGGPLVSVHAVHHRQHNTCRMDSTFIHPVETAMGQSLMTATMVLYALVAGKPDVLAMAVTWFLYIELNLHNHGLWKADHFPFRTLNYLSVMHHNHHDTFDKGNYGSLTMFYDWLFGTLDYGKAKKEIHLFKRKKS